VTRVGLVVELVVLLALLVMSCLEALAGQWDAASTFLLLAIFIVLVGWRHDA
jgi:hypothetical protein